MALFNECTQSCARIVLDMADIVRDGDLSPTETARLVQVLSATLPLSVSTRLLPSFRTKSSATRPLTCALKSS